MREAPCNVLQVNEHDRKPLEGERMEHIGGNGMESELRKDDLIAITRTMFERIRPAPRVDG